jgi:hypothetical protein
MNVRAEVALFVENSNMDVSDVTEERSKRSFLSLSRDGEIPVRGW